MIFNNVVLESIAYVLPPSVWSSEFIEQQLLALYKRLKLPLGRLELMTGIRERRFWPANMKPSEASAQAAQKLLDGKTIFNKDDVDLLIHTSVCRDRLEPSTATYVHHLLKLSDKTQVMDISNACLGFLNGIVMAAGMIESNQIKTALIVSGENGKPLADWTLKTLLKSALMDRKQMKSYFANLTIGSGSVAALLCRKDLVSDPAPQLVGGCVITDSSAHNLCEGGKTEDDQLSMQTNAEALLTAGVRVAKQAWGKFKTIVDWNNGTPDRIICHQVGKQHRNLLYEALNLDLEKDFSTFEFLGNTGSASLPITLAISLEKQAMRVGEKIALLGIGSGISSLVLGLQQ